MIVLTVELAPIDKGIEKALDYVSFISVFTLVTYPIHASLIVGSS